MVGLAAMVLADSRFPGGGHAHSGGLEEAVARGLVTGVDDLGSFLHGRLRTAGLVAAAFAAAAARMAAGTAEVASTAHPPTSTTATPDTAILGTAILGTAMPAARTPTSLITGEGSFAEINAQSFALDHRAGGVAAGWPELDAELDARTPSPAQRAASRAQGRATLRAARLAWPSTVLDALCAVHPRPHHPLLIGAVVGIDGGSPADAARCVGYLAVTGPATAAVRLLGLDPLAVNALIVGLGQTLEQVIAGATANGSAARLPAAGAPVLDLMAQSHIRHHREQVRLFAS